MFVLPPPPRYPQAGQYIGVGGPGAIPTIETNNTLTTREGPEYQFLVGEGTYVLKEDLHLATPPPHPSEVPVTNPNPLATDPVPATAGTKLSLVSLETRPSPAFFYKGPSSVTLAGASSSIQEHPSERYSTEAGLSSDGGRGSLSDKPPTSMTLVSPAPAFGDGNAALATPVNPKDAGKKKKPKNNMTKSNSSFISRVILNDSLSKKVQDRPADGLYCFANINRAFQWLDLSSPSKADFLTKILFTRAHCLCHDVNPVTKSASHIDVIMGFSTGEIIWWEPISQRYTRLNKNGVINGTPVSEIRWIPGSENLFLAAHMDGSLVVYDKEKEDAPFVPEETAAGGFDGESKVSGTEKATHRSRFQIQKSVHSKNQKVNPVACWKLSNQRINAFAFSHDSRHLAVVSEDGTLRIIDYLKEELLDLFHSYYGGLTCVCWSPDGKYVLTGGQDDLISIWSVIDSAIVARCQGHQSWVTSVAFDPWRCDDRNYRFGSVGEDCRLCLWDFSVGMLHRPKAMSVRQRGSVSSRLPGTLALQRLETANTSASGRLRSDSALSAAEMDEDHDSIEHPVEPRSHVAMLPPVMSKVVHPSPACWLQFTEDSIMTSCKAGHIRTWSRPTEPAVPVPTGQAASK